MKFIVFTIVSLLSMNVFADGFKYKCNKSIHGGRTAQAASLMAIFDNGEVKLVKLNASGEETDEAILGRLIPQGRGYYARFELTTPGYEGVELITARGMLTGDRSLSHISLVKRVDNRSELDIYVCSAM